MNEIISVKKEKVICLKCKSTMVTQIINGVEVDFCLKCQGIWFDKLELEKVLGSNKDNLLMELSSSGKVSNFTCPKCYSYLYQIELIQGSGIIVETCFKCDGFFLDKGELIKLKAHIKLNNIPISTKNKKPINNEESTVLLYKKQQKPVDTYMFDVESFPVQFFQFATGLPIEKAPTDKLFTPVTGTLIAINTFIFLFTYFVGGLEKWVPILGMIPQNIVHGDRLITIFTSMFTHGGWFHIIGNMYFLFVTGDDVEKIMGPWWFLIFYLCGGFMADLGQLVMSSNSIIPHIGASGAISVLIGAYVVMLPKRRFFFRIFYFLWFNFKLEVPVYVYIVFWFGLQLLNAKLNTQGIAWWTHISGFTFGVIVAIFLKLLNRFEPQ